MALLLEADEIIVTLNRLQLRIAERFPGSGLSRVCSETLATARQATERAAWIARPLFESHASSRLRLEKMSTS